MSTDKNSCNKHVFIEDNYYGDCFVLESLISICQNPDCCKPSAWLVAGKPAKYITGEPISFFEKSNPKSGALVVMPLIRIIPEYGGAIFPSVPPHIWQDYHEACRIRDLSPKASATIARRCLQQVLRDFWGVSQSSLKAEIDEVAKNPQITAPIAKALHNIRELGNIGAHPERDVNTIVDIEPGEVDLMIKILEMLFETWYEARALQQKLLNDLDQLNVQKQTERDP